MSYKIAFIIAIVIALVIASYIVYQNRASDKLVSSYLSILLIGFLGLLINSIFTLKDKTEVNSYAAQLFIQMKPLRMGLLDVRLKHNETYPILFTDHGINAAKDANPKLEEELFPINNDEKWNKIAALQIRHIFELINVRYKTSWYVKELKFRTPNIYTSTLGSIDSVKSKKIKWIDLKSVFKNNPFIINGFSNEIEDDTDYGIAFPPNTTIEYKSNRQQYFVKFDNEFCTYNLSFRPHPNGGSNVDAKMQTAFRIDSSQISNFRFIPLIVESESLFKQFRTGHPDMPKYEHWLNDLDTYIQKYISIENFWKTVELNQ